MQQTALMTPQQQERKSAVVAFLQRVRALEKSTALCPQTLEEICDAMVKLAVKKEWFSPDEFPQKRGEDGRDSVYLLSEDEDKRFALYLSVGSPGKKVPPHNHTTWAVIVGVEGIEQNYFYERADDGGVPGKAVLRRIGEQAVKPGEGVCMMPEDIHHIETSGETPNWHLHLYGLALTQLDKRLNFNLEDGSYKIFAATPNVIDARLTL